MDSITQTESEFVLSLEFSPAQDILNWLNKYEHEQETLSALDDRGLDLTEQEGNRLDWLCAVIHQLRFFYNQHILAGGQVLSGAQTEGEFVSSLEFSSAHDILNWLNKYEHEQGTLSALDDRGLDLTEHEGNRLEWLFAVIHQLRMFYNQRIPAGDQFFPDNNNGVHGDGDA